MKRVNPFEFGKDQDNYLFHLARYMFVARQLKKTDSVLEVGCGTGYGAKLLADFAKTVVAVDTSIELKSCWNRYKSHHLTFQTQIPNDQFDAVVSFEVIEHVEEDRVDSFLSDLKRCAMPCGTVYISTPRALPFELRSPNRQKFHKKEYSPVEFRLLLDTYFSRVFLFAQNDTIISYQNLEMCWNMVAICIP